MKRREFIKLAGAVIASSVVSTRGARTQPGERMRSIGILIAQSGSDPAVKGYLAAFAQGLAPLGWAEGRNLRLEMRTASADVDRLNTYAGELARLKPEVILAHGTETVRVMQQHTRTIPIVFTTVTDPVGSGLAESLARPGGNITGFTNFEFSMAGKWLELLKEAASAVRNVTILFNPDNAAMPGQLRVLAQAAAALGLQVAEAKVRDRGEIEAALNGLASVSDAGLLVLPEFVTTFHRDVITELAARHRLPAIYAHRYFIESGGLISYGADTDDQYRRAASYVDRILKGESPAVLPIQQPTKFELLINLKAAKALGLNISEAFLLRADEVIE